MKQSLRTPAALFAMGLLVFFPVAASAPAAAADTPTPAPAEKAPARKLVPSVSVGADYIEESDGNYRIKVPPTPSGLLPAGTKVLTFEFTLDPENARLEGFGFDGGDIANIQVEFRHKSNFVIIMGQPRVHRVTGIAQRADGQPFKPSAYSFGVYINGNQAKPDAEIKFTIQ